MNSSRLLRAGAVFHWTPTTWADAYRDFTITGTPEIRGGVASFDGVGDKAAAKIQPKGIKTVLLKLRAGSTTEQFVDFDGGSHYIDVSAGTIRAQGFTSPIIYKGGSVGSTLAANETAWIAVTTATGFDASALAFAFDGSNYGDVDIFDAIMFPRVLSATEIANISKGDPFPYDRHIISKWDAGINPQDTIGGNHGTGVGLDATNIVDGPFGRKMISLNGSDEYVTVGLYPSFDITDVITVGAMIVSDNTLSNFKQIISKSDGSSSTPFELRFSSTTGKIQLATNIGGTYYSNTSYDSDTPLISGVVYVVIATYDGEKVSYFIDGEYDGGFAASGAISALPLEPVRIGARTGGGFPFDGKIGSPFIAHCGITKLEAADIYNRIMDGVL